MISDDSDQEAKEENVKIQRRLKSILEQMKITKDEMNFREERLKSAGSLDDYSENFKCTKCSYSYKSLINKGAELSVHPVLKVLMCARCCNFYGDGEFSVDEDGDDKYCRWCGEGGTLLSCSRCICAFCKSCIIKHFGEDVYVKVLQNDDWLCYFCDPKPLWYLRFICSRAVEAANSQRILKNNKNPVTPVQSKKKSANETVYSDSSDESFVLKSRNSQDSKKKLSGKKTMKPKNLLNENIYSSEEDILGSHHTKNKKTRTTSDSDSSKDESRTPRKRKKLENTDFDKTCSNQKETHIDSKYENQNSVAIERFTGSWKLMKTLSDMLGEASVSALEKLKFKRFESVDSIVTSYTHMQTFLELTNKFFTTLTGSFDTCKIKDFYEVVQEELKTLESNCTAVKEALKIIEEKMNLEENNLEETSQRQAESNGDKKTQRENICEAENDGDVSGDDTSKNFSNSIQSSPEIIIETKSVSPDDTEIKIKKGRKAKPILKVKEFAKMSDENLFENEKSNIKEKLNDSSKKEVNLVSDSSSEELEIDKKSKKSPNQDKKESNFNKGESSDETKFEESEDSNGSDIKINENLFSETKGKRELRSKKDKFKNSFEGFKNQRKKFLESEAKKKEKEEILNSKDQEKLKMKRRSHLILMSSEDEDFNKEREDISENDGNSRSEYSDQNVSSGTTSSEDCFIKESHRERIKKKKKRAQTLSGSDKEECESQNQNKKGRKKIKRILKKEALHLETKEALKKEEERKNRLKERIELFEKVFPKENFEGQDIFRDSILDFDPKTKEPLITISEKLMNKLKPHQVKGVKFMWDNCFESLERLEEDSGSGCILAHCLGLGKTFQVITFIHTIFRHEIGVRTVLIVCPLNTVSNWVNEFSIWLKDTRTRIPLFNLIKFKNQCERHNVVKKWHESGGVLLITYDLFRNLTKEVNKENSWKKKSRLTFDEYLLDSGPDVIICDEGHLLKNQDSTLSKCISKIKTCRRIILTGTPLQNNLKEYHCMIQFVKPNLLGTKKEFSNRFMNPILNGQFEDSTEEDVIIMRRRSHVLHCIVSHCIQRYDYSVLSPYLPKKFEYVLSVALTEAQEKVYRYFIGEMKSTGNTKTTSLFNDFHHLQRIWTHPKVMIMHKEKKDLEALESDDSIKDFVIETDEEDSSNSCDGAKKNHPLRKKFSRLNENDQEVQEISVKDQQYWKNVFTTEDYEDIRASNKLVVLFWLLNQFEGRKEKVLVFSQSLYSLDLIEYFLKKIDDESGEEENRKLCGYRNSWVHGVDYFRLDGSTSSELRSIYCDNFNKESNTRGRLFLISTRAGGLGINLCAANRVILFDVSWNPSNDVQSIFRVYRFGQKKVCYIYRLVAEATMEEKIYRRQIAKLSLALRVVDEQHIERHYSMMNLQELYQYDPTPKEARKIPMLPKDEVLAEFLNIHKDIVVSVHEHDSLLQNQEEEELSEEEKQAAWKDYEEEKMKGFPVSRQVPKLPVGQSIPSLPQPSQNPSLVNPLVINPSMINPSMINPSMINPSMINPSMVFPIVAPSFNLWGNQDPFLTQHYQRLNSKQNTNENNVWKNSDVQFTWANLFKKK